MPFEFKSTDYQPNESKSEEIKEDDKEEKPNENEKSNPVEEDNEAEEDVKVIKSAKNSNYNAPRQDHCFIYKITKLL